jgi:hypothetical protein
MVSYIIHREFLTEELFDLLDVLDPYDWNSLFFSIVYEMGLKQFPIVSKTENDDPITAQQKFMATISPPLQILAYYPIVQLDPAVEELIEDTIPNLKDIKVPYPGYFINKRFPMEDGQVIGIFVADMSTFILNDLMEAGYTKEGAKQAMQLIANSPGVDGDIPVISFMYVHVMDDKVEIIMSGSDEIFEPMKGIDKKVFAVMQKAMIYSVNVSNLIVSHSDLKNPQNPKKDVRLIPHYKGAENKKEVEKRDKRFQIIRVFGNLKQYTQSYEKAKRKIPAKNKEASIVKGHWRTFKHERFVNKLGETIWIPPFIRGMDKGLFNKIVQIKP